MPRLTTLACLAALAAPPALAAPAEDWSARIGTDGLARTEAAIAALPVPSPDDLFALGAVRFLRGIEGALNLRWRMGQTEPIQGIPVLRLALPPNPAPEPFRPGLVSEVASGLSAAMAGAAEPLSRIGDADAVGLTVRFSDLWLDIDGDGTRTGGESLLPLAFSALLDPWAMPEPLPSDLEIRFDTADAAWLEAYANLIGGVSGLVLAYDPAEPAARVLAAREDSRTRLGPGASTLDQYMGDARAFDIAMTAILALRQTPDPADTRAVRDRLKSMIAANGKFWARVAAETDNDREWLPNPAQTGAFGVTLPEGTSETWQAVLADLGAMLDGRLLVPHWALPAGSGVNIARFLDAPAPIDVIGWAHGIDALPYAEKGPVIDGTSWRAFEEIMQGNGLMMALVLN